MMKSQYILLLAVTLCLPSCVSSPPRNIEFFLPDMNYPSGSRPADEAIHIRPNDDGIPTYYPRSTVRH